jgi:hypothetical protein
MKTNYIRLFATLIFAVFLAGCNLNPFAKPAGVQVTSNPASNVLINGESAGKTPVFFDNKKAYTIQMTAIDSGQTWEVKVNLLGGALTTVHRDFGPSLDKSQSFTLSFEKLSNNKTSAVNIVSLPANATISIGGKPQGFTPLSLDIEPGSQVFTFTAPGFQDKIVNASVQPGYRLLLNLNMAALDITPTPTPTIATASGALVTPTPAKTAVTPLPKQATGSPVIAKPYIEILTTPTGWLNVRETALSTAPILAKVNPGDRFAYNVANSTASWYQIEYLKGSWGFVSSTYAKLVE